MEITQKHQLQDPTPLGRENGDSSKNNDGNIDIDQDVAKINVEKQACSYLSPNVLRQPRLSIGRFVLNVH